MVLDTWCLTAASEINLQAYASAAELLDPFPCMLLAICFLRTRLAVRSSLTLSRSLNNVLFLRFVGLVSFQLFP